MPDDPRCAELQAEYDNPNTTPERKLEVLAELRRLGCSGHGGHSGGGGGGQPL